jgi:hypothetical protein
VLHLNDLGDREHRREHPLPALFLKRYDSKRVRGWGSAKELKGKDLEEGEG